MKRFLLVFFLCNTYILTQAQLKVNVDGNVNIQRSTDFQNVTLGIGPQYADIFSSMSVGVHSYMPYRKTLNIGLMGATEESSPISSGRSCGVYGSASNFTSGYNYGLFGVLGGSNNGAAVFGTSNSTYSWGYNTGGKYAGFFYGDVYVTNTFTSMSMVTPSDMRLSDNVEYLSQSRSSDNALDNILKMDVISYNYKQKPMNEDYRIAETGYLSEVVEGLADKRHFGLSAQELMNIYPELVHEGQDGFLCINYVELVPILIRSIQELNAKLDEVMGKDNDTKDARAAAFEDKEATAIGDAKSMLVEATLAQNSPNPFKERTTIRFTLPENAQNAFIYIFDMSGKMLKQMPVTSDMQSVTIEGYELRAGMYIYSLVIGGKEIDTKRMILSK